MAASRELTAGVDHLGWRVDAWISDALDDVSRSRVKTLIEEGHIVLSTGVAPKPHARVKSGMAVRVTIPPAEPLALEPESIPLDILHEDRDVIVLNKAAGMVVHPAAGHATGTLVHALLYHCHDLAGIGGELRPGIVHRLDKDTSGVVVVAKNDHALADLAAQFKNRSVRKEYVALVKGCPSPASGRIETQVGRSSHDRQKMSTRSASGRHAITNYKVERDYGACALVRLCIETGRTHQIRVHMAHIGTPVLGDSKYGRRATSLGISVPIERQLLHAEMLAFRHPRSGEKRQFRAPLPEDMRLVLRALDGLT